MLMLSYEGATTWEQAPWWQEKRVVSAMYQSKQLYQITGQAVIFFLTDEDTFNFE